MAQQTAVEWLMENIQKANKMDWDIVFIQAKQMEKEQIIDAFIDGELQQGFEAEAEQYYNETYKQ